MFLDISSHTLLVVLRVVYVDLLYVHVYTWCLLLIPNADLQGVPLKQSHRKYSVSPLIVADFKK